MKERKKLLIILFDNFAPELLEQLKRELKALFRFSIIETISFEKPRARKRNGQLLAYDFISLIDELKLEQAANYALAITAADLYVPNLNFVFGLAQPGVQSAIISTARLESFDEKIFLERIAKEAVHEIGHLLQLDHCINPSCVMHFSNSLLDTDRKEKEFCSNCRVKNPLIKFSS